MNTAKRGVFTKITVTTTGHTLKRIQTGKKYNLGISKLQKFKNEI